MRYDLFDLGFRPTEFMGVQCIENPHLPVLTPKIQIDPNFKWIGDEQRAKTNQFLAESFGYNERHCIWIKSPVLGQVCFVSPRAMRALRSYDATGIKRMTPSQFENLFTPRAIDGPGIFL